MTADKGQDPAQIVVEIITRIKGLGAVAVIPPRRHRKQPRSYDRELYKHRNRIERCVNRPKHFRRFSALLPHRRGLPLPHPPRLRLA